MRNLTGNFRRQWAGRQIYKMKINKRARVPCLLKFTYTDILILCRIQFGMGMGLCFGKTMC